MAKLRVKKAVLWKGFKVGPHNLGITRTGKRVQDYVPAFFKNGEPTGYKVLASLEEGWLPARIIRVFGFKLWVSKLGNPILPRQWVMIWGNGEMYPLKNDAFESTGYRMAADIKIIE